jgi:hypothetical protein
MDGEKLTESSMGCRQSAAGEIRNRIQRCEREARELQALLPVAEAMEVGSPTEAALYELVCFRARGR